MLEQSFARPKSLESELGADLPLCTASEPLPWDLTYLHRWVIKYRCTLVGPIVALSSFQIRKAGNGERLTSKWRNSSGFISSVTKVQGTWAKEVWKYIHTHRFFVVNMKDLRQTARKLYDAALASGVQFPKRWSKPMIVRACSATLVKNQ